MDDSKYKIKPVGRDEVIYSEGLYSIPVDFEIGVHGRPASVRASSIKRWLPPHETEEISDEKKRQILNAVKHWLGAPRKVVDVYDIQPWCEDHQ